jgi:hypothetical protein
MPRLFNEQNRPVRCPFCGTEIPRPKELDGGLWYEFDGGFCSCGAAYALDPTARNGGQVLLQALVMASGGDWDRALGLAPGVDYDDICLRRYDAYSHRLSSTAFASLYFIRLRRPETS